MAKPKKAKNNKKTLADKVIGLPLIIIIVLSISGFATHRFIRQLGDKPNFVEIEQAITDFGARVEELKGSAEAKETRNYCENESMKLSKGRLYCGTYTAMDYRAENLTEAKILGQGIEDLLRQSNVFKVTSESRDNERAEYWSKDINFDMKGGARERDCRLSLVFVAPGKEDVSLYIDEIGRSKIGYLSWFMQCERYSYWEYYPVKH